MARIRSIKPEFWTSEQVMECSLNARLMFVGMWNFADDNGRLPLSAKSIKAQIFPSDNLSSDTILGMIEELSANGLVLTYDVEGKEYLQITGWQHQRIDKPQAGKYPNPTNGFSKSIPRTLPPDRKGEDTIGEDIPTVAKATRRDDEFEEFWKAYPTRDGANPKTPAEKLFLAAVKAGTPATEIIQGARNCAVTESKNVGTPYIPQAVNWLRDKRWNDYGLATNFADPAPVDWDAALKMFKKIGHWTKWGGPRPNEPGCRVPREKLAEYGLLPDAPSEPTHVPRLQGFQ